MNTQGTFEFNVRGYECGPDGAATFVTLCNYLQEAAGLQAAVAHIAKQDFDADGLGASWILTRMRVQMVRYPKWWDTVSVLTYPRGGRKIVAYRDFILRIGDEVIGRATSEWMLMNLETRKLVAVPSRVYALANDELPPALPSDALRKLHWECRAVADDALRFRARRSDIDINGHVNNVRYMEWLIEALPPETGKIIDFEIAFKSETRAGEEVIAEAVGVEPGVFAAHVADAAGRDHVVARMVLEANAQNP